MMVTVEQLNVRVIVIANQFLPNNLQTVAVLKEPFKKVHRKINMEILFQDVFAQQGYT